MGRRKKRPRNTSVSPQTRQTDIAPADADAAPDPVDPPRPNRPLLAASLVFFLLWLGFLLYATLGRLMP